MVSSFAGCAVCHAILATYIFLSTATDINVNNFNWVPVASFSAMIFISACGAMPVPYVVIGEILPNKVKLKFVYVFDDSLIGSFELFRFEIWASHFVCAFHGRSLSLRLNHFHF